MQLQVVTLVTVEVEDLHWSHLVTVKDLNDDSLYGMYYMFTLVTAGHIVTHCQ